jgi:hypothetical protein
VLVATAVEDADLEASLREWRRFRRSKRTSDVHWIDLMYQAYLSAIVGIVIIAVASSAVGDEQLTHHQVQQVLARGPAWLGILAAFGLALGLRSGSRGGPLALERADVRHILLAPVDRTAAVRSPAIRQLRFLLFAGAVVGGIAGQLASKRFGGSGQGWIVTGGLGGMTLVALSVGAAFTASGLRLPRWIATLIGVVLLVAAIADGAGEIAWSPTEVYGHLLLWPLDFEPQGIVPIVAGVVLVLIGLLVVGRMSLEMAERRSRLVGQLRFAATLQDVRTVMVLRRQLALELPRLKPWYRIKVRGTGGLPIIVRDLRGFLRWPAARVARMGLIAAVVGFCLRAAWAGTLPILLVAGGALFIAGLDAVEPLAQEVDHPTRRDSSPMERSEIHFRHLPVAVMIELLVTALAIGISVAPGRGQVPFSVAGVAVVTMALGGIGGAIVSVLAGTGSIDGAWSFAPPEAQGMRVMARAAWPPAVAILGALPVVTAIRAVDQGRDAAGGTVPGAVAVLVLFGLIAAWVRVRDDIAVWWKSQMEVASGQSG